MFVEAFDILSSHEFISKLKIRKDAHAHVHVHPSWAKAGWMLGGYVCS